MILHCNIYVVSNDRYALPGLLSVVLLLPPNPGGQGWKRLDVNHSYIAGVMCFSCILDMQYG